MNVFFSLFLNICSRCHADVLMLQVLIHVSHCTVIQFDELFLYSEYFNYILLIQSKPLFPANALFYEIASGSLTLWDNSLIIQNHVILRDKWP